jgi:hypothetical protein
LLAFKLASDYRLQELCQPVQNNWKIDTHVQGGHTTAKAIVEAHTEAAHVHGDNRILPGGEDA